jgi:hypothetical protein
MGASESEDRTRLLERLEGFDRAVALQFPEHVFELVIVGGGALVLLGVLSRPTDDIDTIRFPNELLSLMQDFDLSGRVVAYADHFPYDFEDRLCQVDSDFKAIRCHTASLEDLIVSKLYSDREVDRSDIREAAVLDALDWNRLASAVEEAELSCLNERRYREMLLRYDEYRKECGPCEG